MAGPGIPVHVQQIMFKQEFGTSQLLHVANVKQPMLHASCKILSIMLLPSELARAALPLLVHHVASDLCSPAPPSQTSRPTFRIAIWLVLQVFLYAHVWQHKACTVMTSAAGARQAE